MLNKIKTIPLCISCGIALSVAQVSVSHSAIVGVVTESFATADFERVDNEGNPIQLDFKGPIISEEFGSYGFGSAVSFDSDSNMGDGVIEFQNGNASYGDSVLSTSRTVVDIFYTNTTDQEILPTLNSQIMAGGFGLYTTSCLATDLRVCEIGQDDSYDLLGAGLGVSTGELVASAEIDFQVMAGDHVLLELSGGISLIKGETGQSNTFVTDFSNIENFLNNFRDSSDLDSLKDKTYDWDATDITLSFPDILALAPNEVGNLTYITEVTTFSDSFCVLEEANVANNDCTISYASFGDPVGRGGGSNTRIAGIDFGFFEFQFPTFEDGIIEFRVDPSIDIVNDVPVIQVSALFAVALGGLLFRRRR